MTTQEHRTTVDVAKILESYTVEQINDAANPLRSVNDILSKPITITSVRERQSDYPGQTLVKIGYTNENGKGQFDLSGRAATSLLVMLKGWKLPVGPVILRKNHRGYYWT